MSEETLTLQQANETSISYVETLLDENDLPSQDVHAKPGCFYIGYDGESRVGVGGVERYGSVGLLRSVVIKQSVRGNGFGATLCEELERQARTEGVETLYLLTTTASEFFANRGYATTERTDVPDAVRQTTEFEEFCPTSASCMKKRL
jgi:amino-acid N-acetyltransferase